MECTGPSQSRETVELVMRQKSRAHGGFPKKLCLKSYHSSWSARCGGGEIFTVSDLSRRPYVPFSPEFYDDETLAVMTRALKEAMCEQQRFSGNAVADAELRIAMASQIMAAVRAASVTSRG